LEAGKTCSQRLHILDNQKIFEKAASGKTYSSIVIYIFKIANGKIIRGQWVMDRMEMAQQLGWIPIPGPP